MQIKIDFNDTEKQSGNALVFNNDLEHKVELSFNQLYDLFTWIAQHRGLINKDESLRFTVKEQL